MTDAKTQRNGVGSFPFYAFTWRSPRCTFNFGDEITPFLLPRLSPGIDLRLVDFSNLPHATRAGYLWDACLKGRLFSKPALRRLAGVGPIHCCIGSILQSAPRDAIVWGSGFLFSTQRLSHRRLDIRALRGAFSLQKLRHDGFVVPDVPLGDPGLLLPLVLGKCQMSNMVEVGLIPHYRDTSLLRETSGSISIINVASADVVAVARSIWNCGFVISSSLHGLVVSHAYGIPAVWMKSGLLGTDDFKFKDYFSSVGIPFYEPVRMDLPLSDLIASARARLVFSLPRADIGELQKKLLDVAPFPVDLPLWSCCRNADLPNGGFAAKPHRCDNERRKP